MPETTKREQEPETSPRDPAQAWVILTEITTTYPDKGTQSLQKVIRLGRAVPRDDRGYFLEIEETNSETGQWALHRMWNETIDDDEEGRRACLIFVGKTICDMFGVTPISTSVDIPVELIQKAVARAMRQAKNMDGPMQC